MVASIMYYLTLLSNHITKLVYTFDTQTALPARDTSKKLNMVFRRRQGVAQDLCQWLFIMYLLSQIWYITVMQAVIISDIKL